MNDKNSPERLFTLEHPHQDKLPTLTTVLARYIAFILLIGMAGYAILQYLLRPEESIVGLVREHLSHVLFLMVLIYTALHIFFIKVVIAPIRHFQEKLYSVSGGDLLPLDQNYGIREIRDIADGINLMIERISVDMPESSLASLSAHVSSLRNIAMSSETLLNMQKQALLDAANEMARIVAVSTQNIIHENELKRNCRLSS
jgi:hypothetical protein